MTCNRKQLLVISPDHILDIITNSSSELFIIKGETLEVVKELIRNASGSSWADDLRCASDLDVYELEMYLPYLIDNARSYHSDKEYIEDHKEEILKKIANKFVITSSTDDGSSIPYEIRDLGEYFYLG